MAGEIDGFVSPSIAFELKPAKSIRYHEELTSKKSSNIMDSYHSSGINEDAFLNLLISDETQTKALQYLDQHLQKNNGNFIFHNTQALFKGFTKALSSPNQKVCVHCTRIIIKIIPQLSVDVDQYMNKLLSLVINNVGSQSVTLQRKSIQLLYVYMKHSLDVYQILQVIASHGIRHENSRIRQQIVRSFPTLLFAEFKDEDFFDVINGLASNLTETQVDEEVLVQVLYKVKDFLGKDVFTKYINRLPSPLRHTFYKCCNAVSEKINQPGVSSQTSFYPKNAEQGHHLTTSSKYPLSMIENSVSDNHRPGNFAKSGHFDTIPRSRHHQHGSIYSSVGALTPYENSSSGNSSHFSRSEHARFELSFIPKYVIEQMTSPDHSLRLQAVEGLREVLAGLKDSYLVKENMVPLLSLLQPVFDDKNFRVACGALRAFRVMIGKIGPEINNYLKLFVFAISRKLGNVKDSVRSECYKVLLQIMDLVGHQKVLNLFWDKLTHKQYKVREDFLCIVIATLLTSLKTRNLNDLDFDLICSHVAARLTDNQQVVRHAALDCIAVLGHILGTTNKKLLGAVDSVELRHDNASGIMSAVHARLLRKQLPRLDENMLVKYAVFPSSNAQVTSTLGADIQWISAADKPKKNGSVRPFHSSPDKIPKQIALENSVKAKNDVPSDGVLVHQSRRHLSAGKHRQFPWTSQEVLTSSTHPNSAPVGSTFKQTTKTKPPFQPRNTWGPDSELSQQIAHPGASLLKTKSNQGHETQSDKGGPSYQEIYKRRKEAQANKNSMTSNFSSAHNSRNDSGYQPSFASRDFSASTSHTGTVHETPTLSNSCPSTFFDKNHAAIPRRKKIGFIPSEETSTTSGYASQESVSPIRLKPALARSASSKRRDNAVASSREFLKTDDTIENSLVPLKLKNPSASPRFDRLVGNTEAVRPIIKSHHNHAQSGAEKFPGPTFNQENDSVGYTPSGLQKRSSKDSFRNENSARSSNALDKDISNTVKSESFRNENHNISSTSADELTKSNTRPTARPIVPSHFSPSRRKSYEDTGEFQLNSLNAIRRSAQNKRERMRSQPNGEESFSNSFSEYSSGTRSSKAMNSATHQDHYEHLPTTRASSQPVTSTELVTTALGSPDPPPFKYNPNNGVTFESKKVDTNVSVVGIRYPSQAFIGQLSSSPSDSKAQSPISSSSTVFSNSGVNFGNKTSSSPASNDRHKPHRGSSLGMANLTTSPEMSTSRIFNVQGKGVFMSPSTTSLLSGSDLNDVASTSSREEISTKPLTTDRTKETNKILDGVCGVAVKQPILAPISIQPPARADEPVSLSASLRERKERQREVLSKNSHSLSKTLFYDDEPTGPPHSKLKIDSTEEHGAFHSSINRRTLKEAKIKSNNKASTLPLRATDSARRTMPESGSKPGSGASAAHLIPLDYPEKSLNEVISSLGSATSDKWELLTGGMYTIRRLATHHPQAVASRFHDVIIILNKHVPSLRSQVSKASVQAITDLYTNLKKPAVDTDIDVTVRTLLSEYVKPMSFIKSEADKTLQAIVSVATSSKTLNALLSTGLRHKNKEARNTAARFCAELVDKMGPAKCLSGAKDTTDRLLDAVAVFISDGSPDVRYYGRYIIDKLMVHEDFNRCVERFLSADGAQELKTAANNVKQRGPGSLSSVGSRKGGSGRSRNGASPSSVGPSAGAERFSPSSSAHGRRKGAGSKIFNEQEQEELKTLCDDLSGGNLNERKSAIISLFDKLQRDRRFVEDNVVKIMGAYVVMLTTAQTKLNHIALESLPGLVADLHPSLRDVTPQLVPALLKLVSSKQYSELALENIDCLVKYVEPLWIIPHFANSAMFGNAKAKQTALNVLTKLISVVSRKKPQIIERQVLPVLWNLLSARSAPSGAQLRKETASLTSALYQVFGQRLLEMAEAKNLAAKVKDALES